MPISKAKRSDTIHLISLAQSFPEGSDECGQAVGEALKIVLPSIKQWVRFFSKELDPDDVAQEISIKIFRKVHHIDTAMFFTWLYRVIANQCIDENRKRYRKKECSPEDLFSGDGSHKTEESTPEPMAQFADPNSNFERRIVRGMYFARLFEILSEDEKLMLELYFFEGLAIEVMAELMCIPEGTFKSKMNRLMRRLEARAEQLELRKQGNQKAATD